MHTRCRIWLGRPKIGQCPFWALDEGRVHEFLVDYDAFREAVITVFGDIDRRGNAENRLGKIRQTGSVTTYIAMFNEHAAQVEWNEASLIVWFRR